FSGAVATGAFVYGAVYERNAFTLRTFTVPVLPRGSGPFTILHLSDAHMMPGQSRKQAWLRGLAELEPDLIVNTGDNLAHLDAVPALLDSFGELLDVPGVFVFGSNDYFTPTFKNPAAYLFAHSGGARTREADLPWRDLRDAFTGEGWHDLSNQHARFTVNGLDLAFAGVDDPHLGYDDLAAVEGPAAADADLAIGVAHAPYLRVLDAFNRDGYPLILAGHTHGGQVAVPGYGALVTNCDLDRERAKGLHQHRTPGKAASWMHVSAGLGTSPYAPMRFACRPEASLLTLTEIDSFGS
ncbi:MAG: metallophosphoesterase, partial [Nocardioidaceae bacterium]|nr:metallophosphoesterase [Nocardioidaceae bacterium]